MAVTSENLYDFEKAIEESLKRILAMYFDGRFKLCQKDDLYRIKDRHSGDILYDGIYLKSVARTVTYCLVTGQDLYLNQLLLIDAKYQKYLTEYLIAKYHNEHKASIHHRDKMDCCAKEMLRLKHALSLRIYMIVNPSASF